jgi:2-C-methyl-D-erythritol 4-phosphate cytidylyltransferase
VPAAGVGKRMAANRPKQYLPLLGQTVLEHTLQRLCGLPEISAVVACVSRDDGYWPRLPQPERVWRADGGAERCHSVLNGLGLLRHHAAPEDWVLVHDAARPCVRPDDIQKLMRQLVDHPVGGLLALPVRDTMKRADATGTVQHTVDRAGLWHALTPQMFRLETLHDALSAALAGGGLVTDEAQAMELAGLQPALVEGHADNIKITRPEDLLLAEFYLQRQG